LRSAALPAAVAVAALFAFYLWATAGTTLEDDAFAGLRPGMSRSDAEAVLPGREAPVRFLRIPPHPPGWTCRRYTDGNFPFGMTTYEVCFAGGEVVRVTDVRREAL
jgi:hypothetical protein